MKKTLNILGKIATVIIIILAVLVLVFTFITMRSANSEDATFFGYKPYIVLSDSMKDTFAVGDVVLIKTVQPEELQPGDIVSFKSIDPNNYGMIVTHKIREITTYNQQPAFVTYGTTTGVDDSYPVPYSQVLGKYVVTLHGLGNFFEFLKTPTGYVCIVLIPFLLLILWQAVNFIRILIKYKKEKNSQSQAEISGDDLAKIESGNPEEKAAAAESGE